MICLWYLHGTTYKYEGVVAHVSRGESFDVKVRDPVAELVVTLHDKDAPLAVKGMSDGESDVSAVVVMR